jgi:uncharacterized protein (DUF1800 family)
MSLPQADWSTAYTRFGYGARGLRPPLSGDPREAIEAELQAPAAGQIRDAALPSTPQALVTLYEFGAAQTDERARADSLRAANVAMPSPSVAALILPPPVNYSIMDAKDALAQKPVPNPVQRIFFAEAKARFDAACNAPVGFVERLVAFWSNHFCVSVSKGQNVRITAGAFEREAIRPFVLGRFADMLQAVESHPAMQHYLDNAQSIGPNSHAGQNSKRGLNENLPREILELHTLGVKGGYAQTDVTEFARVLTGWTVVGREGKLGEPGAFVFNANAHEGGSRDLLGRHYDEDGLAQGKAVLADLAASPATAQHISEKLARAFVADSPSPGIVGRLTQVFRKSDGDLRAVARTLLADNDAWTAPPTKLRDPWQMLVAACRALGLEPSDQVVRAMTQLGMPLWAPDGPNGFSDATDAWLSPEGIKTRVEVASMLGRLAKEAPPPRDLLERVLPGAAESTREAVLRAESGPQAYALMILSPEFQRR